MEADVTRIDINSAVSLRYRERRPYFSRGTDIVRFSDGAFYSRSISNPSISTKLLSQNDDFIGIFIDIDDNEFTWIIDPIDGTLNFMNGIPYFGISIALNQRDQLIAGLVYDPIHNDFYWAEEGTGAYLNDQRLRVTNKSSLDKSVIALGIPFLGRGDHKKHIRSQEAVMSKVAGLRRFGAASLDLAYVAAGKVDGFWEYGLSPWDVAAGIILVKEAGGLALGIDNKENPLLTGNIVAGNTNIVKELQNILNS